MLNKPALLLCAAALAPSLANGALLQDLFDGDCIAGFGVSACNWQLEYDLSLASVDFTNIDVFVEQIGSQFGTATSISYEFNGEFDVVDGDDIDLGFIYDLYVHGGTDFLELELTDVVFTGTGGYIEVTDSMFFNGVLVGEVTAEIDPAFGIDDNPVWVTFDDSYKYLRNEKNILIVSNADGFVSVGDMHQKVPVPATAALLAVGIVGAATLNRRRARK